MFVRWMDGRVGGWMGGCMEQVTGQFFHSMNSTCSLRHDYFEILQHFVLLKHFHIHTKIRESRAIPIVPMRKTEAPGNAQNLAEIETGHHEI